MKNKKQFEWGLKAAICTAEGRGFGAGHQDHNGTCNSVGHGKGDGHCDGDVWGCTKKSKAIVLGRGAINETLEAAYGSGAGCFSGACNPHGNGRSGEGVQGQRFIPATVLRGVKFTP